MGGARHPRQLRSLHYCARRDVTAGAVVFERLGVSGGGQQGVGTSETSISWVVPAALESAPAYNFHSGFVYPEEGRDGGSAWLGLRDGTWRHSDAFGI